MEQNYLISIIVPVYNTGALLPRCIQSIQAQTYRNLEILLIDDGSRDDSGAICDAFAAEDSRIRVIHKENGGQSSARNLALDLAKGEYITCVDSDDWLEDETAYEKMMELMLQYQVKLVCGGRYDIDGDTGQRSLGLCPAKTEVMTAEQMLKKLFVWDGCDSAPWDKLYHRSVFDKLRFPEGKTSEDVAIVYKLVEAAGTVVMTDLPYYNYYHRPNSTTTASVSQRTFYMEEFGREIYADVSKRYPSLEKEVHYFLIYTIIYSVQTVALSSPEDQKKFAQQAKQSRAHLRQHTGFLLTGPYLNFRTRVRALCMAYGIYGVMRKIFTRDR